MLRRTIAVSAVPLAVLVAGACSSSSPVCHVGADCASGACDSSGKCVPVSSGGDDGGGSGSGSGGADVVVLDVAGGSETGPEGGTGSCLPDDGGVITRTEFPMLAGLHASFLIATSTGGVTVDTSGTSWDLSGPLAGDQTVVITTDSPSGQWFASKFTTATYTSLLSEAESTLLGVYQATNAALLLQGAVSTTSGTQQTEVSYSPSAEIIAVPMQMGSTWTSTSTVQGTADGIATIYTEKYDSSVDARGTLKVPYGSFDVLRVQTTLTRTVGAVVQTTQTMTFVAQCFGPVARLTSQTTTYPEPPPGPSFTNVVEAWRLAQ
jgi:hypothetical protein